MKLVMITIKSLYLAKIVCFSVNARSIVYKISEFELYVYMKKRKYRKYNLDNRMLDIGRFAE